MKENQRESKQIEIYPCPWISTLNMVMIFIFLNLIYRFNTIPIKSNQIILLLLTNQFLNLYRKTKDPE